MQNFSGQKLTLSLRKHESSFLDSYFIFCQVDVANLYGFAWVFFVFSAVNKLYCKTVGFSFFN